MRVYAWYERVAGKLVTGVVLAASLLGFSGVAQAGLFSCPPAYTTTGTAKVTANGPGLVTAASACQYLTPASNDPAKIPAINAAVFFGTGDWSENPGDLQVDTNEQLFGTWSIDNANFTEFDYIMVFKDGNTTNFVAFLLNETVSQGAWTTPFTSALTELTGVDKDKKVSHYTIARRASQFEPPCIPRPGFPCGEQEVPEPGTLTLLGIGALGAAVFSRRRRKASMV